MSVAETSGLPMEAAEADPVSEFIRMARAECLAQSFPFAAFYFHEMAEHFRRATALSVEEAPDRRRLFRYTMQ